ncbi:MAG: hypothetical protein KUG81_01685 [Gammaproteobacteria bacterium]|nr:hypothetical protein [Gammaproteobacteria bacterium]
MKAKEHIYNLKTNLSEAGSQLQFTTDQHLMFMLDEARATLASRKMDAKVNVIQMSQTLDKAPVTATSSEIGQIGDTRILKVVVPDPIAYLNGGGIFTVGPTDGQESYTRISYSQLRTVLYRKYTASSPKWFWLNDAIYIINSDISGLEKVRVRGIFDEPYKVVQENGLYKYLDPFNWEYPLTMKDSNTVYKLAISGDLGWGDTAARIINNETRNQNQQEQMMEALKQQNNA